MADSPTPPTIATLSTGSASPRRTWPQWQWLARFLVHRFLQKLRQGCLTVVEGQHRWQFGAATTLEPAAATLVVQHPRFYQSLLSRGSRGLGEAYIRGEWTSPDLSATLCLLLRAYLAWEPLARLLTWLPRRPRFQRQRRNTLNGSRRNIAAHYDLGNDFYATFLDPTMAYSCAIFPREDSSLTEAQLTKFATACRKLRLQPSDHLLEIGTGWGGLALYAARHYGCRVTTTTISRQQYDCARRAVQRAGLADRITVLATDYRHLQGHYDKLVSIEMIEAVGHEYLPEFFRVCSNCLKPDGLMVLQAITIPDRAYRRYLRTQDFIRSHIFPGGCLVSLAALSQTVAAHTDLRLVNLEDLTPFYVRTLRLWRQRFLAQRRQVRALGFSDEFIRLWEFYFCYCEAGFREGYTGDVQLLYAKPRFREALLPSQTPPLGTLL